MIFAGEAVEGSVTQPVSLSKVSLTLAVGEHLNIVMTEDTFAFGNLMVISLGAKECRYGR
jgi:hypothetical protein